MSEALWKTVDEAATWLDRANGRDDHELTCRILKVAEESGEAAKAWIGCQGQNPRKGVVGDRAAVAAELADVAMAALVAVASLGVDPREVMDDCAAKFASRAADSEDLRRIRRTSAGAKICGRRRYTAPARSALGVGVARTVRVGGV